MGKTQEPTIKPNRDEDFTCVTFYPDLRKFGMEELEDDTIALLDRRAYDIAGGYIEIELKLKELLKNCPKSNPKSPQKIQMPQTYLTYLKGI